MINYIKAELKRITKKRSTYIYFGSLILIFIALFVIGQSDLTGSQLLDFSFFLIPPVSFFVTIHVFITVYCDDMSSKTYSNIISTGLSRTKLILSKLVLFIINTLSIYVILTAVFLVIYYLYGGRFNSGDDVRFKNLIMYASMVFISSTSFASISSIILYGFQKSVIAITIYIALAMEFVNTIMRAISSIISQLNGLANHTLTSLIASSLNEGTIIPEFWLVAALYIGVSLLGAYLIFRRKDIQV